MTLVSERVRPTPAEKEEVEGLAQAGVSRGFVQFYEDAKGRPVFAVSFWKPATAGKAKAAEEGQGPRRPRPNPNLPRVPAEDHTDDLYFAKKGAKPKRRKKAVDPHQLDLFTGPDQQGLKRAIPTTRLWSSWKRKAGRRLRPRRSSARRHSRTRRTTRPPRSCFRAAPVQAMSPST